MNRPSQNRSAPHGASNSSDESSSNGKSCHDIHLNASYPYKCIYDEAVHNYKMRLQKAQMDLNDKNLVITMLRDKHVKMETVARNSIEEYQKMKANYRAMTQDLDTMRKNYETQFVHNTKQANSTHTFESFFKQEVERWNQENRKILDKIDLMDFDIQKLIQLMAEKYKIETDENIQQQIGRIEKLIANQSDILTVLTNRIAENTTNITVTNANFSWKFEEIMEKTDRIRVDLLDQITALKRKTEMVINNCMEGSRRDISSQFPIHGQLDKYSPFSIFQETSKCQKTVQKCGMNSNSPPLDSTENIQISIAIQRLPPKDTGPSDPHLGDGKNSSILGREPSSQEQLISCLMPNSEENALIITPQNMTALSNKRILYNISSARHVFALRTTETQTPKWDPINVLEELAAKEFAHFERLAIPIPEEFDSDLSTEQPSQDEEIEKHSQPREHRKMFYELPELPKKKMKVSVGNFAIENNFQKIKSKSFKDHQNQTVSSGEDMQKPSVNRCKIGHFCCNCKKPEESLSLDDIVSSTFSEFNEDISDQNLPLCDSFTNATNKSINGCRCFKFDPSHLVELRELRDIFNPQASVSPVVEHKLSHETTPEKYESSAVEPFLRRSNIILLDWESINKTGNVAKEDLLIEEIKPDQINLRKSDMDFVQPESIEEAGIIQENVDLKLVNQGKFEATENDGEKEETSKPTKKKKHATGKNCFSIVKSLNTTMVEMKKVLADLQLLKDLYQTHYEEVRAEFEDILHNFKTLLDSVPNLTGLNSTLETVKVKVDKLDKNMDDVKNKIESLIDKYQRLQNEMKHNEIQIKCRKIKEESVKLDEEYEKILVQKIFEKMQNLEKNACRCSTTNHGLIYQMQEKTNPLKHAGCLCKSKSKTACGKTEQVGSKTGKNNCYIVQTCLFDDI